MSKSTPGPWFIWQDLAMQREGCDAEEINDDLTEGSDFFGIYAGDPTVCTRGSLRGHKAHICDIDADSFEFDDDEEASKKISLANARLIASAPDLLEALESVWLWMENQADSQSKGGHATFDLLMLREQRDIASAAIAKATGETK